MVWYSARPRGRSRTYKRTSSPRMQAGQGQTTPHVQRHDPNAERAFFLAWDDTNYNWPAVPPLINGGRLFTVRCGRPVMDPVCLREYRWPRAAVVPPQVGIFRPSDRRAVVKR